MRKTIDWFVGSEDGAVSSEFVVVTGGAVGIALAVMATIGDGILDTTDAANTSMEARVDISYGARVD